MMEHFVIIGISDNPNQSFPQEVLDIIQCGKFFSGGRRHHEIVAPLLPADAEWIDITTPLDDVFQKYAMIHDSYPSNCQKDVYPSIRQKKSNRLTVKKNLTVIVFASGDPLFFGFANTIRRKLPDADITIYPSFNSLQMLAHRLLLPYHDLRIVSLTGRPWPEFDRALIEQTKKIGVLTDKEHTPAAIAQRMSEYGYTDYTMYVGEHLGNPTKEKVMTLSPEEAVKSSFDTPNCLIICFSPCNSRQRTFGIPDTEFALLDGREKMITKMPIRLLTLQALDLPRRHVLWDIGACTGSVSIEARLLFPHLSVEAFEIRPECEAIIRENTCRHGAPGISLHIGNFLEADISALPRPDAVFIGGHGGHLRDIMAKVLTVLTNDGVIVMNSVVAPRVTTDSRRLWDEVCRELCLRQEPPLHIQLNDHHPITILKCKR